MFCLKLFNLLLAITLFIAIAACNKSSSSNENDTSYTMPVMNEQSTVRNGCINIQAIQSLFNMSSIYPGYEITTDFNPDSKLSNTKSLFHTNAAFSLKEITTSDIHILLNPTQADCSSVLAKTISGEALNFTVSSSSPYYISFSLQKPTDSNLTNYRKEGLEKKLQPTRYDIQILSSTHLRVTTFYKSFDANCRGSKLTASSIQKDYIWGQDSSQLPTEIALKESFYSTYLSTIIADEPILPQPFPQADLQPGYIYVSVDKLRSLSLRNAKEELKICVK